MKEQGNRGGAAFPRKRKKRHRPAGTPEERILDGLGEICRDAWRRCGKSTASADDIDLNIRVRIPSGKSRPVADPPLARQVDEAVREAAAREDVYRAGRVYCYRCETADCSHGTPPAPQKVFTGYSSTGHPLWTDFSQLLLEKRHPDADTVFRPKRLGLSSLYLSGEELRKGQLPVFGKSSRTYAILGQVALGYLQTATRSGEQVARAAVTAQAVEVWSTGKRPRLVLNLLGRLPDGAETIESLEGERYSRLFGAFSSARRALATMHPQPPPPGRGAVAAQEQIEKKVAAVLKKMAKSLQRTGRQGERRTSHAEERQRQRRPTAKAVEDAGAAADDRLFYDEREGTVVVAGPRGRVHVFSLGGRHITSLSMRREEIDGRRRRRRWRTMDADGRRRFRGRIARLKKGL